MHPRNITKKIEAALLDTPVVLLNGARQTGKSTLVKWLASEFFQAAYFTLDNAATLSAAASDPTHFIEYLTSSAIIDEVQRAPNLFLAIKESVDENRKPGRFLLTGSANVLLLPTLSDSLAGRMEIINLWPLSQGEIDGVIENFIDTVFATTFAFSKVPVLARNELMQRILLGGFPEVLTRETEERRYAWFENYITTILQRDVRDLANIEGLTQLPRLLGLLTARIGCLLNLADISRISTIAHTTLSRYMTLLQTIFLIHMVPAWSNNQSKRIVKAPKLYLCDTGLSAHLAGITEKRLHQDVSLLGPILENFVINELKKQLGWNKTHAELFHYRTTTGNEVDFILEDKSGNLVGIEVKASSSLCQKDFKGLQHFSQEFSKKFLRGIVLYTGDEILPFGKNLYAIPIQALWQRN